MAYNTNTWFALWNNGSATLSAALNAGLSGYASTSYVDNAVAQIAVPHSWLDPVKKTIASSGLSSEISSASGPDKFLMTDAGNANGISWAAGDIIELSNAGDAVGALEWDESAESEEGVMFYHAGQDAIYFKPGGTGTAWQEIGSALGGSVQLKGGGPTNSAGGSLFLLEATANGTHKATFQCDDSLSTDRTITVPDADVDLGAIATNTGKVTNVSTNLTNTADASSLTVHSSDGSDTALPAATTSTWGVMTDEMFDAMALNTAKVTNVSTNLGVTQSGSALTVTSSDGVDVDLPLADTDNWGVMSDEMFDAIATNTAKATFPGFGTSGGTALEGDTALLQIGTSGTTALAGDTTTITTAQAGLIADIGDISSNNYGLPLTTLKAITDELAARMDKSLNPIAVGSGTTGTITVNANSGMGKYFVQGTLTTTTSVITLPDNPTDGFTYFIKVQNITGTGSKLTVGTAGTETIDGAATFVLDEPYSAAMFTYSENIDGSGGDGWLVY